MIHFEFGCQRLSDVVRGCERLQELDNKNKKNERKKED
jgi:hypothetical protein